MLFSILKEDMIWAIFKKEYNVDLGLLFLLFCETATLGIIPLYPDSLYWELSLKPFSKDSNSS